MAQPGSHGAVNQYSQRMDWMQTKHHCKQVVKLIQNKVI
jgi:hypothetical protein